MKPSIESPQMRAARFLAKIAPKKYKWERDGCAVYLLDLTKGIRYHTRNCHDGTQIVHYLGYPPIFSFRATLDES